MAMSDEEIICTWMEPRPRWPMTCEQAATTKFWGGPLIKNQYSPRELDLDALHEVEARLTDSQWEHYETAIASDAKFLPRGFLHADAGLKIKALAETIRIAANEKATDIQDA